jgi:hypothetical protein
VYERQRYRAIQVVAWAMIVLTSRTSPCQDKISRNCWSFLL